MSSDPASSAGPRRDPGLVPDASVAAIAAHRELRSRVTGLLADVDPALADATPVPACPAWTVTETVAHLVGVCIDIADGAIGDDVGTSAWADSHSARFAPMGIPALLVRWAEVGPVIDSLEGLMPPLIASQFVFDAASHEHDVRGALGLPGARDSDAIAVGLGFVEDRLDAVLRATGVAPMEWRTEAWTVQMGEGDAPIGLTASPFEIFRTFGGRRSVAQIRAMAWSSPPDEYLDLFGMGPLEPPTTDLVE